MSATHTYVLLGLSRTAYEEIKKKLEKGGYSDQFIYMTDEDREDPRIDMSGIAIIPIKKKPIKVN